VKVGHRQALQFQKTPLSTPEAGFFYFRSILNIYCD
jgi:hypothetical protein